MKTIEETIPVQITVHDWCPVTNVVPVERSDDWYYIRHERDIPSDWSDELRRAVCEQVIPNRKLAENELRTPSGNIHQLRVRDSFRERTTLDEFGHNTPWLVHNEYARNHPDWKSFYDSCEQWYSANEPKRLADNEIEGLGVVWQLRWHEGSMQCRRQNDEQWGYVTLGLILEDSRAWFAANKPLAENETWNWNKTKRGTMSIEGDRLRIDWEDGQVSKHTKADLQSQGADWERRRKWYEANLPKPNQFRESDGRLWTFTMRDDGEAGVCGYGLYTYIDTSNLAGDTDWSRAAIAYRDKERARWMFSALFPEDKNSPIWSKCDELSFTFDRDGEAAFSKGFRCDNNVIPTWVRIKAREMWEEKQVKKPETHIKHTDSSGIVAVMTNHKCRDVRVTVELVGDES